MQEESLRKNLQYLVLPKDALINLPSKTNDSSAKIPIDVSTGVE
jgi:hypothetical protein